MRSGAVVVLVLLSNLLVSVTALDPKYNSGEWSVYRPLSDASKTILQNQRPLGTYEGVDYGHAVEEQCTVVQFQFLGRHGERYPFGSMIDKFIKFNEKIRPFKDYPNFPDSLRSWNTSFWTSNPTFGDITGHGTQEIYQLAKRIRARYPQLEKLIDYKSQELDWNSNDYRYQASQYIHTIRSASVFGYGLFEGLGEIGNSATCQPNAHDHVFQPIYVEATPDVHRRLTAYNDLRNKCPKLKKIADNADPSDNLRELLFSPIAKRLIDKWEIGVFELTDSDVSVMFQMCAFELSLGNIEDKYCSIFSDEDFESWRLYKDVSSYYEVSYGFAPNAKSAAVLLQEIFILMDQALTDPEAAPKTFIRFAHHQTLGTFLSLLASDIFIFCCSNEVNELIFFIAGTLPRA
jgi:multiple inositol-polyphosphate phosphatase / 2,3-bisphosphoglycerate 3-phosphatase